MSVVLKFLFGILTDPLGLPIDLWKEYFILAIIGEIAYQVAYAKAGNLYDNGFISTRTGGSIMHWSIRLPLYFIMWAITYGIIWLVKWIMAHRIEVLLILMAVLILLFCVYFTIIFIKHMNEKKDA